MSYLRNISNFKKNKIIISVLITLILCLYFSYYTIYGKNGIIDYFKIREDIQTHKAIQKKLESELRKQKDMIKSIKIDNLDLDLLDEQTRKNLGYAKKDEIIIYEKE
jgi:cell division protein FtsB